MTFDPKSQQAWRDLAHTAAVVLGSALAQHDIAKGQARSMTVARRFDFELMAASTSIELQFSRGELIARGGGMRAVMELVDGKLHIKLQLVGYAMLKIGAGTEAHLVSKNGMIDHTFQFSLSGSATCIFADTPEVRQGLNEYSVEIFD